MIISCGFFANSICQIEVVPFYLLSVFIWKDVGVYQMLFLLSFEIDMWFWSFILLILCITLIDFQILNQPYISGINPAWSWCTILFICYWFQFAGILRIFLYIHKRYCSFFFFFFFVKCLFWYQGNTNLIGWVRKCSFCFNFLEEFVNGCYSFLFKYLLQTEFYYGAAG